MTTTSPGHTPMTIFVDTSALLAILAADGDDHAAAKGLWQQLVSQDASLACANYTLVEAFALAQRRLGMGAARTLQEDLLPVVVVDWVNAYGHGSGVSAFLIAGRRDLSLVDCVSFDAMRRLDIETAFAFDRHFAEQGFSTIP